MFFQKKHATNQETVKKIASVTNGFSGADLENLVNESAYIAVNKKEKIISDEDLEESFTKLK